MRHNSSRQAVRCLSCNAKTERVYIADSDEWCARHARERSGFGTCKCGGKLVKAADHPISRKR